MSTSVLLRPNATDLLASGLSVTGAGSAHAALSDASDSSYVRGATSGLSVFEVTTTSIPTGAIIKDVRVWIRHASNVDLKVSLNTPTGYGPVDKAAQVGSAWTFALSILSTAPGTTRRFIQSDIDAFQLWIVPDGGGNVTIYDVWIDVVYNEWPTVTVTNTAIASPQPIVNMTYSDPDGDSKERHRVKIFTAAQYGITGFDPETSPNTYDSGEVFSSSLTHSTVGSSLQIANGTTYKFYAKAADAGSNGRYSAWASTGAIVASLDLPAPPDWLTLSNDGTNARQLVDVIGRLNQLTEQNADVETAGGTGDWQGYIGTTVARTTSTPSHGVGAINFTMTQNTSAQSRCDQLIPVIGSVTYTTTAVLKYITMAGSATANMVIDWYSNTAGTTLISTSTVTPALTLGSIYAGCGGSVTSPSNAVTCRIGILWSGISTGDVFRGDQFSFARGVPSQWYRGGFLDNEGQSGILIQYSHDNVTWKTFRSWNPRNIPRTGQEISDAIYDFIPGKLTYLRLQTRAVDSTGAVFYSTYTTASSTTLNFDNGSWWIKPTSDLSQGMAIDLYNPSWEVSSIEEQAEYNPFGKTMPVVVSDVVHGLRFQLMIEFTSAADRDKFKALRNRQEVMLLQSPWLQDQWYIRLGAEYREEVFNTTPPLYRVNITAVEQDPT